MAITWLEPDAIREAVAAVRALTDRPFGVNIVLDRDDEPQDERVEVALEAGVPIDLVLLGRPGAAICDRVHAAGAKALLTVGSAAEARPRRGRRAST